MNVKLRCSGYTGHIYHFLLPVYEAEFQKNLRISKSTYLWKECIVARTDIFLRVLSVYVPFFLLGLQKNLSETVRKAEKIKTIISPL